MINLTDEQVQLLIDHGANAAVSDEHLHLFLKLIEDLKESPTDVVAEEVLHAGPVTFFNVCEQQANGRALFGVFSIGVMLGLSVAQMRSEQVLDNLMTHLK